MPTQIIGGGLGAVGGIVGAIAKAKAAKEQAKLQNEYIQKYGAGQGAFLDFLKGLTPADLTSTMKQLSEGTSAMDTTSSMEQQVDPTILAQFAPDVAMAQGALEARLRGGPQQIAAEEAAQLRRVNAGFAPAIAAEQNLAARLGQRTMGAGGAGSVANRARVGNILDYQSTLPELARARQTEDIGLIERLVSEFGKGQRTTGSSRSSSRGSTTGSMLGSSTAARPLPGMEAFLPAGPQTGTAGIGLGALGGGLSGLGELLAMLPGKKKPQPAPGSMAGGSMF